HGKAWNTHRLLQRHAIFLGEIQILVPFVTHTDVDYVIILVDQRRYVGRMKSRIQNVAVVAPVRAEYKDHALVVFRSCGERGSDFGLSLLRRRIKIDVRLGRFGQTALWIRLKIASLRRGDPPIATLLIPNLRALNHER